MIRINLIPPEFAQAQTKKELQVIVIGGFLVLAVFFLGFWSLKNIQARNYEKMVAEKQIELQRLQAIVDQINEIEGRKRKLIEKRDVIVNLNKARLVFPVFFEDLLPLIPSDVWVTEIRLERQSGLSADYKLISRALTNFALATWLTNLEQSTHFSGVKLDRIAYEKPTGETTAPPSLSFQLTFSYQHQGPMPLAEFN